jgi:hypothetical protein
VTLDTEILKYRRQIATDGYPMSIGELANLYRDGELDIHPEFQRIFRWKPVQKTRLIESILLGIPLPSIFVAQNESGVWDVVDGVQRLSTIFQFMGILEDEEGERVEPFSCGPAPFLKQLDGTVYDDGFSVGTSALDSSQRLDFKRARIDVKIIKRESDNRTKYDLFQRLNSFGSVATEQELRNCLLVSMSKEHFEWLGSLSTYENFLSVIDLPDRLVDERYHMELALRFIFLRKIDEEGLRKNVGNIGEFLTSELVPFVERRPASLAVEKQVFERTFDRLHSAGANGMLKRWNPETDRAEGPFSLTAFETLALGLGHYDAARRITANRVAEARSELWADPQFEPGSATGVRADQRMRRTIPFGRELFRL